MPPSVGLGAPRHFWYREPILEKGGKGGREGHEYIDTHIGEGRLNRPDCDRGLPRREDHQRSKYFPETPQGPTT